MATQHSRTAARAMMAHAVFQLLVWMLVPLAMTLWFSTRQFLPRRGGDLGFVGQLNPTAHPPQPSQQPPMGNHHKQGLHRRQHP